MKQSTNFFVSITALLAGGILYILFRENTHIGKVFSQSQLIELLRNWLAPLQCNLVKFHLPDFLWGLSLGCGLHAVLCPKKQELFFCGIGAFVCGTIWECLQFLGVVSGTGDCWDVVSYGLSCVFYIILNWEEKRK